MRMVNYKFLAESLIIVFSNPSNSGVAYIVFSASSSFYIPMIIVIFVYVRIYIAACAATKSVYSGMMEVNQSPRFKNRKLNQP